jgi:hypothetical protein
VTLFSFGQKRDTYRLEANMIEANMIEAILIFAGLKRFVER